MPLIERELRVALRKQRPVRSRLLAGVLAASGCILFLFLGAFTGDRSLGRSLELLLCLVGLYYVQRAPMLAAGVLAEERRNQTLGLLFLSGLGAGEVFASKLLSSALVAFTNLLAIFPMLALPFLIGGVSFELFLGTTCMLPVLMLFALSVSLLASVLTRDEGAALVMAIVLIVLVCGTTPAIFLAQSYFSNTSPSQWWWRLSPADAPRVILLNFRSAFGPREQAEFWQNLVATFVWSGLALGAAAFALKRLWRDQQEEPQLGSWRARWHEFQHGSHQRRQRLGQWLLELNPFAWLARRDRQPALLGWLLIGGIILVWSVCYLLWPTSWASVPNFFVTATLLNLVLTWLTRHTAAQAISQGRRDGAYELLLTTPLEPRDIISGTLEALRGYFRVLANLVLALNIIMMWCGLSVRRWTPGALVVYFVIWLVLLGWSFSPTSRIRGVGMHKSFTIKSRI